MVEDAYVNNIPVMTGEWETSSGRVLFQILHSTDTAGPRSDLISRTIGTEQLVDEMVLKIPPDGLDATRHYSDRQTG